MDKEIFIILENVHVEIPVLTPLLDHLEIFINNCFGRQKENYKTVIVGALTNISLHFKKS